MRIVHSKGYTKLGTALPEERSRAGFRKVVFFFLFYDGQSPKNKCVCQIVWFVLIRIHALLSLLLHIHALLSPLLRIRTLLSLLTFIDPCIANIFADYNQQDATFHNLFISVRRSTCFRRFSVHHQELKTAHTASGICQAITATCC